MSWSWLLLLVAWALSLHYTALHSSARDRDPEGDWTASFIKCIHIAIIQFLIGQFGHIAYKVSHCNYNYYII